MKAEVLEQILLAECRVWRRNPEKKTLEAFRREAACGNGMAALKAAVEALSGGRNTVMTDRFGYPSVMVRVPALRACDLLAGDDSDDICPAFRFGDREIPELWVGKYITSRLDGHPVSLPMAVPEHIGNYCDAFREIKDKGDGWCLMPWQVWYAIALSSLRNVTLPGGNTDEGVDYYHREEAGILGPSDTDKVVLCGSGPFRWAHDHTPAGIRDLAGSLNEWLSGLRLLDGEIQMVPMRELLHREASQDPADLPWTALDRNGRPVAPGGEDTLRYAPALGGEATFTYANGVKLTAGPDGNPPADADERGNCDFRNITAEEGFVPVRELLMLGLMPERADGEPSELGWRWIAAKGETYPLAGGAYRSTYHSGVFFTGITQGSRSGYGLSGSRMIWIDPAYLNP